MSFNNIFVVSKRELRSYYNSPIAYIVAIVFLIVSGVFFWTIFFVQNQAELRNYLIMLPWLLTFIIPAITMKLFAEEKNTGSYELLVTLPLNIKEIILGKFFAAGILVWSMLLFIFVYGFSVNIVGDLDWGPVIGGYVGSVFLSSTYLAIGLFSSSLTNNQIIAFIVALSINLSFFLIDKFFLFLPSAFLDFFSFFSSEVHFKNFSKGIVDSRDMIYFLFVNFIFIYATYENLKRQISKKK